MSNETRRRHRFVERSIEDANASLRIPEVALRLGSYAARLTAVGERLYIPNLRYGRLTIPAKYKDTDKVPVVPVRPGQKVRISDDFNVFSPRQRQHAARTVTDWRPTQRTPEEIAALLEEEVRRSHTKTSRMVPLDTYSLAAVNYRVQRANVVIDELGNPLAKARYLIKGRPFVGMQYTGELFLPPQIVLHEYEHIDQHEREPIVCCANDHHETVIGKSYELEAYHVGALALLGLRDSGHQAEDLGDQMRIDTIRLAVNGPGSFAYGDEIEMRLADGGIRHLED
ncbi:MAG TPA: hypothetical protein VFT16_01015 [Candidatus Saccharimonadales bacterium]|nr:hypothetical protein [Candidatus Saccharimonadales bacterium]